MNLKTDGGSRIDSCAGYITVYLALAAGVMLSLLLAVIEGTRRDTIRLQTECSADMALDSALAQYHRQMLAQYDLFFVDTSYGTGNPSFHRTENQISGYMEKNLAAAKTFGIPWARDLTGLSTAQVSLLGAGVATDGNGEVLKYHAVQYMKDKYGVSMAEKLLSLGSSAQQYTGRDIEAEWDAADESMKEEMIRKWRLKDEEWENDPPETPSDAVRATRGEGILGAAAQGFSLSQAAIPSGGQPSVRNCNKGTGLSAGRQPASGMWSNGMLYAYILEKCPYFGKEKDNSALSYEVEYILQRQPSDMENLKKTAQELLMIREAANAAFLFQSSLRSQAAAAAAIIASAVLLPEMAEAIETVILFAWAYAESVKDIRILFKGGKTPLMKTEATWNTPFSQLLTYRSHLDSYHVSQEGLTYQDYLGALLFLHGGQKAINGLMDMMEADIRRTDGNARFRIDGLVDHITAEIIVNSKYGMELSITRTYEYE